MQKKEPKEKTPLLPDDERCARNDGKQWRCKQRRAAGHSMCDYHLEYQRNKGGSANKLSKGNSKSNSSTKDDVKSGKKRGKPKKSYIYGSSDEYSNKEDTSIVKSFIYVSSDEYSNEEDTSIVKLSKKIFEGEDPQMCHRCPRNDNGGVITSMACMKKRFGVPCINCWQNTVNSDTETEKKENGSILDLKQKINELESQLLDEEQRCQRLLAKQYVYKCECSSLKEIISGLEKKLNTCGEREAQDRELTTQLLGMMASYDVKLAEFMKKNGYASSSLRDQ